MLHFRLETGAEKARQRLEKRDAEKEDIEAAKLAESTAKLVESELEEAAKEAEEKSSVSDTILVSRFRLNIDGIAETDNGVKFEARVRIQAEENADNGEANSAAMNGARFSVSYGGLRVDAGNTGGAIDNMPNYYGKEPGLENFIGQYSGVNYDFLTYSSGGTGANAIKFSYGVGGFGVGASYNGHPDGEDQWDISTTYTFGNVTAALAYGQTDAPSSGGEKQSLAVLTLGAEFGDFTGTLLVADDDVAEKAESGTAYGVSAAYKVSSATTLNFAYGDGSGEDDTQAYGIGAIYDLGGGASLRGGIGRKDSAAKADFGAQFNF